MAALLPPVRILDDGDTVTRADCDTFIAASYRAFTLVPKSRDWQIQSAYSGALESFARAGTACLAESPARRDRWLVLGRSQMATVEQLLRDRYDLRVDSGVPELEASAAGARDAVASVAQLSRAHGLRQRS